MKAVEMTFDAKKVRQDFPILSATPHGKPLVYLDNAATGQKPQSVIDAVADFYRESNSNVHRGVHFLSSKATGLFEGARDRVRDYLNAADRREIIFVRGTTEAVNLVAQSFVRPRVGDGDEILITWMEHHSNIVPWQLVCEQTGATLKVVPIDDDGNLVMEEFDRLLTERTKMLSFVHVSNALGTVNPVREIVAMAKARGVPVMIDGAQAVPHMPVDVREIGADFYAFSSHKAFGPTGMGVLYGRAELLDAMPPWHGGGDMILSVSFEGSTWNDLPYKFEAGTPNVAGAVGMAAALDYLAALDTGAMLAHEHDLVTYATEQLSQMDDIRIVGTAEEKAGVVSFLMGDIHPHDIGTILDMEGVAIRTGHHCAQPVMQRYGVPSTARASFAFYNTRAEVDALVRGLVSVRGIFT